MPTVEHCYSLSDAGDWNYLKQMQLKMTLCISQGSAATLLK